VGNVFFFIMLKSEKKKIENGPSANDYNEKRFSSSSKIIKKDLNRFVKWPKYIKIQRQRRIFCQKLKVPPAIYQFTRTLDKNMTNQLFSLLFKYKNGKKIGKTESIKKNLKNQKVDDPFSIKHGINSVAKLIKKQKSLFVLIAHDVNPIECVLWMPTLCAKMGVPYCIVKNKSRLGSLVNRKKTSCIALTYIKSGHNKDLEKFMECFKKNFNERYSDAIKRWSEKKL
jgi:large subunit ribosomal protein L7Ae